MERKGRRGLEREREKEILFRIERVSIGISMATISRRSSYFYLEINGCGCSRIYVSNWVSVTCFAPSVSLKGIKPSSSRFKFNSTRIRTRRIRTFHETPNSRTRFESRLQFQLDRASENYLLSWNNGDQPTRNQIPNLVSFASDSFS